MKKQRSKKTILLACMAVAVRIALLLSLALLAWWGNTALTVTEITVSGERIPEAFRGFRIAHVSDLHNAEFGKGNKKLLRALSESRPNMIAVTGDAVDSRRTDIDVTLKFMRAAAEIAPVYYVPGNHEARISQYRAFADDMSALGVAVLEDRAVALEFRGASVALVGLADPGFTVGSGSDGGVSAMIRRKLNDLTDSESGYTVLLSHRPELFETYAACGIDLALCGHAHGGQIRLPWIGGVVAPNQGLFPKYDAGLYAEGNTNMVVSRGLGNSIAPLRINNRPELVVIELG